MKTEVMPKQIFYKRAPAMLGVLIVMLFTMICYFLIIGGSFTVRAVPGFIIFQVIFVFGYSFMIHKRKIREFNFGENEEEGTYWNRNRSDIISGMVVSMVGAIISSSITLIVIYIINN